MNDKRFVIVSQVGILQGRAHGTKVITIIYKGLWQFGKWGNFLQAELKNALTQELLQGKNLPKAF